MNRTLILMRHCEAVSWDVSDQARKLTANGVAAAYQMGQWLAQIGPRPHAAAVSSARRTRETWAGVCRGAGWSPEPADFLDDWYSAGTGVGIELLQATRPEVERLIVVGHNPTMAALAYGLDNGVATAATTRARDDGMVPGTAIVLSWQGEWTDLAEGSALVVAAHRPAWR